MPTPQWIDTWLGGRVRLSRGKPVWVIERRVGGGARRAVALDVDSEPAALRELAMFEADPVNYQTKRRRREEVARKSVQLDVETLRGFEQHASERVERKELTDAYVKQSLAPYLGGWAVKLAGRDLRKVSLSDLRQVLKSWPTAQHKRIVALKAFTAWLRAEDRLKRAEDPTLDLVVPTAKSTRSLEERAYSADLIERFYAAMTNYSFPIGYREDDDVPPDAPKTFVDLQPIRDVFLLRAKTGMHGSEIDRLASGDGSIRLLKGHDPIAATLSFPHKKGGAHVVSIDAQTLAAAERLVASGTTPSRVTTGRAIARVITKNEKEHPDFEGFALENLRHSFITLTAGATVVTPKGGGVPIELVAQLVGHTNTRTTRRHYLGVHVPPMAVLPLKLVNPDDPVTPGSKHSKGSKPSKGSRRGGIAGE